MLQLVHDDISSAKTMNKFGYFLVKKKKTNHRSDLHLVTVVGLFFHVPVRQRFLHGIIFEADCTFQI
jgi:hypothetical protein